MTAWKPSPRGGTATVDARRWPVVRKRWRNISIGSSNGRDPRLQKSRVRLSARARLPASPGRRTAGRRPGSAPTAGGHRGPRPLGGRRAVVQAGRRRAHPGLVRGGDAQAGHRRQAQRGAGAPDCREGALEHQKSDQGALVRVAAEARAARVPHVRRPDHRPSARPRGLTDGSAVAVSPTLRSVARGVVTQTGDDTWTEVLPPMLLCYTTASAPMHPLPPLAFVRAIAMLGRVQQLCG
jgi:hypothetical protein